MIISVMVNEYLGLCKKRRNILEGLGIPTEVYLYWFSINVPYQANSPVEVLSESFTMCLKEKRSQGKC